MRTPALLFAALLAGACDTVTDADPEPLFAASPGSSTLLVERAWGHDVQWDMIKPRPPGIGASDDIRVNAYIIAPVDPADPLSPAISIPGFIDVAGRDHVLPLPHGGRGTFRAVARSVPVVLPGWLPEPPWLASCDAPDLGPLADRIAWAWLDPAPHPCGRAPQVFAARLDGEACVAPLTSVARVEAAVEQGLVQLLHVPFEPAWNFAVRPLVMTGGRPPLVTASACVPAGER
jgi:hypothetical protein